MLCTFWLGNVLRATAACNFSSLIRAAGSAPAALASLLFDPSEPQIIEKHREFRDFLTFSRTWIFFLLTFSLLWFSCFFSSLRWFFPPLLFHFSILSEVWLLNFFLWFENLASSSNIENLSDLPPRCVTCDLSAVDHSCYPSEALVNCAAARPSLCSTTVVRSEMFRPSFLHILRPGLSVGMPGTNRIHVPLNFLLKRMILPLDAQLFRMVVFRHTLWAKEYAKQRFLEYGGVPFVSIC